MAELQTGTMIDGRYRVLHRLGSGGMADVFLAEDQQLGRKVALKLLHRRFSEDPGFVERFRREAQAAAGLQHPNVVGVYDRGDYDGTYYIAMEYLEGRSLKQVIRQDAPLDPIRAIDLTVQILKAARFAHRHGVIHRDLKPHNVIVDDSDHVKVTDFGIARAGASDMTETGSIMGTAQYLSPEQAQGHAVSESSDLYSVGVILYELLTGHVPFDADSAVTIALKHVSEAPTAPTQVNPAVPPALEEVVMWTLNKNPADRPRNADELIAALEAAKAAIRSGTAGERTAAMAALAPLPAAAALVAPVPPVATPPLAGNGGPPDPLLEAYEEERRQGPWPWIALLIILLLVGGGVAAYLLTRTATVPQVIGQNVNTARTILQDAGFKVDATQIPSPKPVGQVIGENPAAGAEVKQGSMVSLTYSGGPGTTTVPAVTSLSLSQAKQSIRKAGLKVGRVVSQSSRQYPSGQVISTSPQAGTTPQVGTTVEIFLSTGPPKVKVPGVVGQSQGRARSTLQNAGFNVTTNKQTTNSSPPGTVLSQSPSPGTPLTSGSTVTITVAQAPLTATVPSVVGEDANTATSQLQKAGFKVTQATRTVVDKKKNNIVLKQTPRGGSTAKKGSTVTIVVGQYQQTTPTTPTTTTTTPGGP